MVEDGTGRLKQVVHWVERPEKRPETVIARRVVQIIEEMGMDGRILSEKE